jgi:hypothetical protein
MVGIRLFRQRSVRQRLGSIRQCSSTFLRVGDDARRGQWEVRYHIADYAEKIKM